MDKERTTLSDSPDAVQNTDSGPFVADLGHGLGVLRHVRQRGTVLLWYHGHMAMNLRLPENLDRRLDQLAAEEHTSKSALLLQGAELVLQRHRRSREIGEGLDFVMSHDAELLTRLEDA
ncbi:ribbon-helix-helix protein, CopG family [Pseudarthrobacter sp. YS3]|uniref:ribbon-helix-helix protein, CopG family n=1 Tax=Pseudarthrobacter sp. YS3 TaxID=3453718 RepID=UPI003EEBA41D